MFDAGRSFIDRGVFERGVHRRFILLLPYEVGLQLLSLLHRKITFHG